MLYLGLGHLIHRNGACLSTEIRFISVKGWLVSVDVNESGRRIIVDQFLEAKREVLALLARSEHGTVKFEVGRKLMKVVEVVFCGVGSGNPVPLLSSSWID